MDKKQYKIANYENIFSNEIYNFLETDPDLVELLCNFISNDVIKVGNLDSKTRIMAILSTLIGCNGIDEFKLVLNEALEKEVTCIEIKEIVYQAVAYLGIGRVIPFLKVTNEVLKEKGMALPLASQSTTNKENRLAKGIQAQVDIFGEGMKDFYKSGPEDYKHINYWLASNCFGDYYTRTGLNYKQREMITFCFLLSQGGCETQLISHSKANIKIGNDKNFLISIISQCLPFIGYPRSLNAINCVNIAVENIKSEEK